MLEAKEKEDLHSVSPHTGPGNIDPTDIGPTELVQRIRNGDRDAETCLIRKYSMPLMTLMRYRVKDPDSTLR